MKILREPRSWSGLGPTALRYSAVPRRGSGPSKTKHLYFPSGSHWCNLKWKVGKSLESRCLSYEVRLPPFELEIPGVEIEKKRSRCCNEDPQIQVLLSPKEGRQNLWPVQNEKDVRSLHGVRVVEELSILVLTQRWRDAVVFSSILSFVLSPSFNLSGDTAPRGTSRHAQDYKT